jgi:hypothetical protein
MFSRISKKRGMIAGFIVALVVAGAAVAYFTSSGTGTGQAKVGSSTAFAVSFGTTTGTMYPGTGTSNVPYTITNPTGSGAQYLTSTSAAVANDGSGNIKQSGTAVSGCLATWFTATDKPPAYGQIADGGNKTGSVDVVMANPGVSQDSCQGKTPDIVVTAN